MTPGDEIRGVASASPSPSTSSNTPSTTQTWKWTTLLLAHRGLSAQAIFGSTDAMKLRSCTTLFAAVAPDEPVFQQVLDQYCAGAPDGRTLALLQQAPGF